ncbi:hypothetical protein J8L86_20805, partial [Shewanella sp. MMG014]|uniref:hypothetical protein n=1 Tax=Shewanella sp. MMG014 TaxID=2822691 RepID=UPI001B36C6EF
SLKKDKKQLVFAPSSLILTNYFLPLNEALSFNRVISIMSYKNTIKLWKTVIITFWALAFVVVFLPLDKILQSLRVAHLAIELTLIGVGITLLIFPIVAIFKKRRELTVITIILCTFFLILFNLVGSMIMYFWFSKNYKSE